MRRAPSAPSSWAKRVKRIASAVLFEPVPAQRSAQWQHLCTLAATTSAGEILAADQQSLLYHLFHQDPLRLFEEEAVRFACSCSRDRCLGALLTLFLIWRISTSEQVIIGKNTMDTESAYESVLGSESPFFILEQKLREIGYTRGSGELLAPWLSRIGFQHLKPLLTIHNQWRFDPDGVTGEQKQELTQAVESHLLQVSEESAADAASFQH